MRFSIVLLFVVTFVSCDYWPYQKKEQLQELDTIVDYTSVDTPPLFAACQETIERSVQLTCFQTTFSEKLTKLLIQSSNELQVSFNIDKTIIVEILISNKGNIQFQKIDGLNKLLLEELPKIEKVIKEAIDSMPKIQPAIKRGIPVATTYKIPVRIKLKY